MDKLPSSPSVPDGYTHISQLHGRVSLAQRVEDGQRVAVKTCPAPATPDCLESLQREAEVLARVTHANIVRLIDWLPGPTPSLLTRFESGSTLAEHYGDQPPILAHGQLVALLRPLLAAVKAIHDAGFIHRDLSAHNVLLKEDGTPVLLDFGTALEFDSAREFSEQSDPNSEALPTVDQATANFAPPERYTHGKAEGPWSDVYSLAAIAYGFMTGGYPPPAPDRDLQAPLPRPHGAHYLQGHPERFVDTIVQGLALNPSLRYSDIDGFSEALELSLDATTDGPSLLEPASIMDASGRSDLPATEKILRRPGKPYSPAPTTAEPGFPAAPPTKPHRTRPVFLLLLLAALALAGWHWGLPWYRSHLQMEWVVDPSGAGDALTIGEALALAPRGARIAIKPGEYRESLLMNRPLSLMATGPTPPRIRPPSGPCLRIQANSGRVAGLDLSTPEPPGTDAAGNAPSEKAVPCIEIVGGSVVLEDNHVTGNRGPALLITAAAQPSIALNRLSAPGGPGIVVEAGSGGTIASNLILDTAKSAIIMRGGSSPVVHCNQIEAPGQAGLLIGDGSRPQVETNRIQASSGSGIEVRSGAQPVVLHNFIDMSGESGLYLHSGAAGQFKDNQVLDSGYSGVTIASGARPLLVGNTIGDSSEHGILVLASARAKLDGNKLLDNLGNGLVIAPGAEVLRKDNQLSGNQLPQILDGREK